MSRVAPFVLLLFSTGVWAQDFCEENYGHLDASQRLQRQIQQDEFFTGRDIIDYWLEYPDEFLRDLMALGPEGHFVDAGSGKGRAVLTFFEPSRLPAEKIAGAPNKKFPYVWRPDMVQAFATLRARSVHDFPKVTAISFVGPQQSPAHLPLRFLSGRLFEDIPLREIAKADLIGDFYGIFAYSARPSEVLKRYGEILQKNGVAYIAFDGEMKNNRVRTAQGEISLLQWLYRIPGLKVESLVQHRKKEVNGAILGGLTTTLRLSRVPGQELKIPQLKLIWTDGDTPPRRILEEI